MRLGAQKRRGMSAKPRQDRPRTAEAPAPPRKESLQESALAIAQGIWGRGNLSPLDAPFGAIALVKLIPTGGFGFIGRHLGQRLSKYMEDTGAIVDAAEAESSLSRLYAKPKSPIRPVEWNQGAPVFKARRHTAFMLFQSSALDAPLEGLYSQGALALKPGGKLMAADMIEVSQGSSKGAAGRCRADCANLTLTSLEEHARALKAAGLAMQNKFDLTADFLAGVRHGLNLSLKLLEEVRSASDQVAAQRVAAFGVQLETWRTLYQLAEARKIEVTALLAVRQD